MNELKVLNDGFKVAMTSLQVADVTGKNHADVMRDIRDESKKLGEEIAQSIFAECYYINSNNRSMPMYNLSRDGAMQLGARYDATTRYKMIQRINELESANVPQISEEQRLVLSIYNGGVEAIESTKALVELKTKPLMEKIEEDKPKVEYHDNVLKPSKLLTTTKIAKDLGMSAVALNKILVEKGIQYKKSKTWFLYSKYEDRVPEYADYEIGDYGQILKWTEKGRAWVIDLLKD